MGTRVGGEGGRQIVGFVRVRVAADTDKGRKRRRRMREEHMFFSLSNRRFQQQQRWTLETPGTKAIRESRMEEEKGDRG